MAMQRATLRSSPKLRATCCCWKWSPAVSQTNSHGQNRLLWNAHERRRPLSGRWRGTGPQWRSAVWRNGEQDRGGAAHRSSRRSGRHDRRGGIRCSAPCHGIARNPQTLRSRPVRSCFKLLAFPPNKVPEGIAHQPLQAYSPRFAVAEACAGSIRKPLNRATNKRRHFAPPRQDIRTCINNYRKNKPAVAKLRKRQRQRALSLRYERRSVSVGKGPIGNSDLMADAPSDTKENPCWLGQ
jgi:hypothetical protein